MRCKWCDYSPYTPSMSLVLPPKGVRLTWDDKENGWTCGGSCGNLDTVQEDDEILEEGVELVEYAEGEVALSTYRM